MRFNKLILVLVLVMLAAPMVEAGGVKDKIKDYGSNLKDFSLTEFYEDRPGIVDFIAFAIIFCAVLMFALAKVGGEGSHWGIWAGLLFGLVLAVAAVITGLSLMKFKTFLPFFGLLILAMVVFFLFKAIMPKNPMAAFVIALVLVIIGVGVMEYVGWIDIIPAFGKNKYQGMSLTEINTEIDSIAARYKVDVSDLQKDSKLNEWDKLNQKIERIRKEISLQLGDKSANKEELKQDLGLLNDLADFGRALAKKVDQFKEKALEYKVELGNILESAKKAKKDGSLTEKMRKDFLGQANKVIAKLKSLAKRYGGIVTLDEKREGDTKKSSDKTPTKDSEKTEGDSEKKTEGDSEKTETGSDKEPTKDSEKTETGSDETKKELKK